MEGFLLYPLNLNVAALVIRVGSWGIVISLQSGTPNIV